MEEVWSSGRPATNSAKYVARSTPKHTQWPGDGPTKGKMGDPIFDYYAKTDTQTPMGADLEKVAADDVEELLDLIGQPVVLLLHSGVAPSGLERRGRSAETRQGHCRGRARYLLLSKRRKEGDQARDASGV